MSDPAARSATPELARFAVADAPAVNAVALAAWSEYRAHVADFSRTAAVAAGLASLAGPVELTVARLGGELVGVVGYVPPRGARESLFPADWALIRMLSVAPAARGRGIGRALTEACLAAARRDGAETIGLHTSPVMAAALALYRSMGFVLERQIPDRNGIPYALYARRP